MSLIFGDSPMHQCFKQVLLQPSLQVSELLFQGISVLFNASINGVTVQLESLLQRSDFFNKQAAISPANRLTYVEVS